MRYQHSRSGLIRLIISMLGGTVLGGFLGFASAQDRPPGQLDFQCLDDCAGRGYDAEHCNKICWIVDPAAGRAGEVTDWICMTDCADRGGGYAEGMPERYRLPLALPLQPC